MGYESRIYVVEKSTHSWRDDGKVYASVIAMVNMCKCYPLSDILRNKPSTNCYIYNPGSDEEVVEDCYGKPLTECSVSEAIKALKKVTADDDWWRYDILLATLKEVERLVGNAENIVVLHYGY